MELVRKKPAREGKRQSAPYIFIAPAVLLLLLFAVLPIIIALTISFTDMDLRGISNWSAISFVGIENYRVLLSDPIFLDVHVQHLFLCHYWCSSRHYQFIRGSSSVKL